MFLSGSGGGGESPSKGATKTPIKTERPPQVSGSPGCAANLCPTYHPTEDQFRDPILYIQSVQSEAEQYGMCKIVPPNSWKVGTFPLYF